MGIKTMVQTEVCLVYQYELPTIFKTKVYNNHPIILRKFMYFNASFHDVYCKGMGRSIPHAGTSFPVVLFIMNWSDNGLIQKSKPVT
jgi:hypothetical protein